MVTSISFDTGIGTINISFKTVSVAPKTKTLHLGNKFQICLYFLKAGFERKSISFPFFIFCLSLCIFWMGVGFSRISPQFLLLSVSLSAIDIFTSDSLFHGNEKVKKNKIFCTELRIKCQDWDIRIFFRSQTKKRHRSRIEKRKWKQSRVREIWSLWIITHKSMYNTLGKKKL